MGSSISMTNLLSWVIFFVPCLVQTIPIKLLTVKSHPIIIGHTKSLHTTNSCENIIFPIWNFTIITPCVTMSLPDAFLNFGTFNAFSDNFSLPNRYIDMQLFSAPVSSKALTCYLEHSQEMSFLFLYPK